MCPVAVFEEGTELVLDREAPALTTGWSEVADTSAVRRAGAIVTLAIRAKNLARAAWAEKSKYALGALSTEGGKTYKLIKAEPEAEKSKPTTDAGVHWEEVAHPATICTLPAQFRPPEAIKNAAGTVEVTATGEVIALDSLAAAAAKVYEAVYAVAGVTP